MNIRNIEKSDREQWNPLWQAYLVFYETSLPDHTTDLTWDRFFDSSHVFTGFVAEEDGKIVGIAHAMLRQSTWEEVGELYLEDLFTIPEARGKGVGRALLITLKITQSRWALGACIGRLRPETKLRVICMTQ